MNCDAFQSWLIEPETPLDPRARTALDEHLARCADCRARRAEAATLLRLLDDLPEPEVRVDARAVLAASAARTDRARRRWRTAAVLATAAALLLAAWAATRVDVEVRPGALTVAWGSDEPRAEPAPATLPSTGAELARLQEIAGLLAAELEDQDHRHRRDLALLVGQIRQLQTSQRADMALLERDFRALYAATQASYVPAASNP